MQVLPTATAAARDGCDGHIASDALVARAREVCPDSNATRANVVVTLRGV